MEPFPREQLNVRIGRQFRNALSYVCHRYSIKPHVVIEIAPLLFLITAEKSLAHRNASIDEVVERFAESCADSKNNVPHLQIHEYFGSADEGFCGVVDWERESIERRDIFGEWPGEHGEHWVEPEDEKANPYLNFLLSLLADLPSGLVEKSPFKDLGAPDYTIARDALSEVTELSLDNEEPRMGF